MTDNLPAILGTPSTFDIINPAHLLAQQIAKTDFVPLDLRNKPEAILACILTGHELGLGPMQSLSKIHVIHGRPGMAAELMRALIQSAGHEIWVEEHTTTRCVMGAQRAGAMRPASATYTIDDARTAGLAGKDIWRKYPRAMLLARCTAEIARANFADVLAGISYTVEELNDGDAADPEDLAATTLGLPAPTPPAKTRARKAATGGRAAKPAAALPTGPRPVPPLPGEGDEPVDTSGPRVTGPALIAIRLDEHGITDRGDRLAFAGAVLGHVVETTKTLTPAEITLVLEAIDDDGSRADAIATAGIPPEGDDDDGDGSAEDDLETPVDSAAPTSPEDWRALFKAHGVRFVDALRYVGAPSLSDLSEADAEKLYSWTIRGGAE